MFNETRTATVHVVLPKLRDRNKIKRPDLYGVPVALLAEFEPTSYTEAFTLENSQNWIKAMENSTWILVDT